MPIIFDSENRTSLAAENPLSLIGQEVCTEHVTEVWDSVFKYIQLQIAAGHGVKIPGLGTISFKVHKMDISSRVYAMEKVPHILMAADLVSMYALKPQHLPYTMVRS
jgi:nucleoid DNA-binding protein